MVVLSLTTARAWDDNHHGNGFGSPTTGIGSPRAAVSRRSIKRSRKPWTLVSLSMRMPQMTSQRLNQIACARSMTSSTQSKKKLAKITCKKIGLGKGGEWKRGR